MKNFRQPATNQSYSIISTMRLVIQLFIFSLFISANMFGQNPLEGRWDITIQINGQSKPSWLEVTHSGFKTFVGRFVGISGSARPISKVSVDGDRFQFSIPPQWEEGNNDLLLEGRLEGNRLNGTIVFPDGQKFTWQGQRAGSITQGNIEGKKIALITNNISDHWHADGPNTWRIENGVLRIDKPGANLITNEKFSNFKLHVEFRYPSGGNSGVYLRGRHELQISDSKGKDPSVTEFGAIYGFIAPNKQVAAPANEWQSYDITLNGRTITVIANGETIICEQEIPGITGGALDSNEAEPGPIMLQGDHSAIEYRNITIYH